MPEHQTMFEKKQPSDKPSSNPLIISLILLIGLAGFIRWNLNPSENIIPDNQNTSFSAVSAKQMLSTVLGDETPHPLDSPEIRITEKRLVKILRSLGYQEEIQETRICNDYKNGGVHCTQVRNIIVAIEGENNESGDKATGILLSSHYDSVDAGPGASDAGVAVATLLEVARLMSTLPQPKNTIVLLFNEGEEYGLFGAKAFMQQHPLAKKLKLAINVEARGSKGSSVMFETGENSGWLVQNYLKQSPKVLSSSLFYEVYKTLPNDTDLTVFKKHGLQGLNFAHAEKLTHYHTPLDNLANLELATIQHHGDNVWSILKNIKEQNLNAADLVESNLVYTDILGMFSLQWQESSSLTASILLLIVFIYSIYRLLKVVVLSRKSIRRGVYSFFIFLVMIPTFGYLLQLPIKYFSSTNEPWLINNFPMQLALWSLLSLITLFGGRLLLKNCQALSVMVGLVGCWIIVSIASSYFVVGISFLFLIPSAISVLMLFLYPYCLNKVNQPVLSLGFVIHALVIAIIFMPIVYTLEIMVSYHMTIALSIMFAFVMIGLLPILTLSHDNNLSKTYYSLLAVFIIGTGWTMIQPSFDMDSKQRINLYYLQNEAKGVFMIAGHENNKPSDQLFEALNSPTLDSILPWSKFKNYHQKIENKNFIPSQVKVSDNKRNKGNKDNKEYHVVNFSIDSSGHSSIDSTLLRGVRIYIPKKSNIKNVTFFGFQYDLSERKPNSMGYIEFRCIGMSCQNLKIELEKTSLGASEILIVKVLQGLHETLEYFQKNRGNTAHQSQYGDQSLIVTRVEI
jgi:hypothetical protein